MSHLKALDKGPGTCKRLWKGKTEGHRDLGQGSSDFDCLRRVLLREGGTNHESPYEGQRNKTSNRNHTWVRRAGTGEPEAGQETCIREPGQ